MNESLLKRVCVDMLNKNGTMWDGMYLMSHDVMVEQMRSPDNFVEFLRLFTYAVDIENTVCIGNISSDCVKCKPDGVKCPRSYFRSLYPPKKYNILHIRKEIPSHTVRTILPGKFTKEQAQKIIDAYNSPDYTMEEIK